MKLTVIGSMGAYPSDVNPTSGYLLQHEGFSLMLDFGSAVLFNLQKYIGINDLDAVYLSHYHPDHCADIGVLQHAVKVQTDLGFRKKKLPIYGFPGKSFFDSLDYHSYTEARALEHGKETGIGPFRLNTILNPHPDESASVRITVGDSSIVYTGDTGWNDKLAGFAEACSLLLCETSLYNRFSGRVAGHLTAGEAGRLAAAAGAGELALCHFPHFGNHAELTIEASGEFDGKISPALPGTVYELT